MDSSFELKHFPGERQAIEPALLFQLQNDDPETARVTAGQQLLFPAGPRGVAEEIGLDWWAALRLYEDGWLSFSPENTPLLNEGQEAELRFIGSLVIAGCDHEMLKTLLAGLPRPYTYDLQRLYFDWVARRWRVLPVPGLYPEAAFTDWLERLVQTRDVGSLSGIGELAQDALSRVQRGP